MGNATVLLILLSDGFVYFLLLVGVCGSRNSFWLTETYVICKSSKRLDILPKLSSFMGFSISRSLERQLWPSSLNVCTCLNFVHGFSITYHPGFSN